MVMLYARSRVTRVLMSVLGLSVGLGLGSRWVNGAETAKLSVASDFAGGSAEVLGIDVEGSKIEIRPALRFGRGWPCWWYFRVDGATAGRLIKVVVRGNREAYRGDERLSANWALPQRAAISTDDSKWVHTPPGIVESDHATYQFMAPATTFWMAWGPPYLTRHAEALLADVATRHPTSTRYELSRSREGRPVQAIRIGGGDAATTVWLQARQHAWESGSSWVADGFLRWVAGDEPQAKRLRAQAEIHFIPIMDVDNVELGAGGKDADPRDHNRDWAAVPIYPEVAAAQVAIGKLIDANRLKVFLDLHNPGPNDNQPFYFGPSDYDQLPTPTKKGYDRFLGLTLLHVAEPSGFFPKYRYSTYVKTQEERDRISRYWVAKRGAGNVVSLTLETSWDTPDGTVEGYRQVGAGLARTVAEFLAVD